MKIIDGRGIAQKIIEELKRQPIPQKIFAAVLVGNDSASESFIRQKEKTAKELGIDFRTYRFPENSTNDSLRKDLLKLTQANKIGGVIVQLPLPQHINSNYVLNVIPREKDIDVLGERAIGAFYNDRNSVLPPSVETVKHILKSEEIELDKKTVAIIGLGKLVGKSISVWIQKKCKNLILLDKGSDLSLLKNAEVVISGAGQANLIKLEMLKDDALVIDFGYGKDEEGKISGDLDDSSIRNSPACNASRSDAGRQSVICNLAYTSTPGGTGPILVASLMENFYKITEQNDKN